MSDRDLALFVFLAAGWIASVVLFAWPEAHCPECPNKKRRSP